MKSFNFFMPTQIRFGVGRISELKEVSENLGKKCLLISRPLNGSQKKTYERINGILNEAGVSVFNFDEIIPNPTTEGVERGIEKAVEHQVDFILGVGGGSVMDSAKLIAFLYNAEAKINWDNAIEKYSNPFAVGPSPKTSLPFVAVSTTSGTGSQSTQAAVVSDTNNKNKVTIFHSGLFPYVSIVDPELMLTVPAHVTAATGFDAFTHAFESYLGNLTSPLTESMSLQAIKIVFDYLPIAIENPADIEARTQLAWADTLAGICLANGGAQLPHPLGEIIGGICPRVPHGETLAIVYPEFLKYKEPLAQDKFDRVARYINSKDDDRSLGERIIGLMKKVRLSEALQRANLTKEEHKEIMNHPLLTLLMPENTDQIKKIMSNSLA
ncbi:iron-containing alcohol dehydrogenase [Maribacter algicola]|uniref:Iron-containing alcohol dehydrogenase n=1 Tax=Meishania litoralis TaxID=3434685 RepID=A0ACC7LHE8_9FLAO